MKYQCLECRRIWTELYQAKECCQPVVATLKESEVMPCLERGQDCEDEMCDSCQGTGWQYKPQETVKG